ncbi:hypothetical protein VDG05_16770 [Xanthomonas campestris pv. raphani]|uniref:hypothetical protein n=1 Tax=Xanthomonas campestris TaxID=339 RepID=UPI002B22FCDC|nr:hypothetical protein [Xanthomonas campestris]MEB1653815.1 hypothetical protein [Xanthomonas campestris pv. campestris]MEA9551695.1 hypothetical protein [Xanthomonas campestris]MEA9885962.1 hypothetical protein [Xanthomonas campestris pv. raphani]MEB1863602.1 hypothetical protein [Xanthomonas campestris pv. campestris]MEB1892145.1 hypothetical protein [Xanthomonas campestris pv. campestris]
MAEPSERESQVCDIQSARKNRETYRHAALTLNAFDGLEHEDRRTLRDQKAEAEREARRRL